MQAAAAAAMIRLAFIHVKREFNTFTPIFPSPYPGNTLATYHNSCSIIFDYMERCKEHNGNWRLSRDSTTLIVRCRQPVQIMAEGLVLSPYFSDALLIH